MNAIQPVASSLGARFLASGTSTFKRTNNTCSSKRFNWSLYYQLSNGDEKKMKEKCFFFGAKFTRVYLPQFVSRLFGSSERTFSVHLGKLEYCRVFGICVHLENSFFTYFFIQIKIGSNRSAPKQCPFRWCLPRFGLFVWPRKIQLFWPCFCEMLIGGFTFGFRVSKETVVLRRWERSKQKFWFYQTSW